MSRIGKKPVDVPDRVQPDIDGAKVRLEGPLGELELELPDVITAEFDAEKRQIVVARRQETARARALHGLWRSLIANAVQGVSVGFAKALELYGTGYSANLRGKSLVLQIGFCHEVVVDIPDGLDCEVQQTSAQLDRPARFTIKGIDKQKVGQLAATIRALRPPEPYKGKGIRHVGEYVRRKEGKAFTGVG